MAAPMMKNKNDRAKSLQNAISGISRYISEWRMEKLNEALSYLRKKIATDNLNIEIFSELHGISSLLRTIRKLILKCHLGQGQGNCKYHEILANVIQARLATVKTSQSPIAETEKCAATILALAEKTDTDNVNEAIEEDLKSRERCDIPPDIIKSLEMAISILANCCYIHQVSQEKVSSLLGIPLLTIIFHQMSEESLLNRVCRCVANLSSNVRFLDQILDESFVEDLVPQLSRTENDDCQRTYIRAIRLISASRRGLTSVTKHRGVVAVAARIASPNTEVRKVALRTLLEMAGGQRFDADAYEQIVVSKCLDHLVPWLSSEDQSLRHDAQGIIYKLLISDQIRAEFGNAGGIDYLYKELSAKESRKPSLIQCLLWCTRESVNRVKIRENGSLDLLVQFLTEPELKSHKPDLIAGLCNFIYDETSMQKLLEKKIVAVLLDILLELVEIPKLDIDKLVKKIANVYYNDTMEGEENVVTRYSMDSPSYQHNEWEWTECGQEILCKTNFEPIWHSPARCESVSSGGYSPASSTSSYWSPPVSPGSSYTSSPPSSPNRRSPSPPPSPPSPIMSKPDESDTENDEDEDEKSEEPSKSTRAVNHTLALLLRFSELEDSAFFKENAKNLTSCLLSYLLLSDDISKNLWILLSRLFSEVKLFTDILETKWPYRLSVLFLSDSLGTTSAEGWAVRRALQHDCCVKDCDRENCSICQHCEGPSTSAKKEVRQILERLGPHCESYYGRGTLAQMIGQSAKKPAEDQCRLLDNVTVLCRGLLSPSTTTVLHKLLLKHGGVKHVIDSYLLTPDPPAFLALSIVYMTEGLPWTNRPRKEACDPNLRIDHSDSELEELENESKKRKSPPSDCENGTAKRRKRSCLSNDVAKDDDVAILLDDGSQASISEELLCEASDVFRAMLRGHFSESSQKRIRLKAVKSSHLLFILHCLKCSIDCPELKNRSLGIDEYLQLLRVSDQYMLLDLKDWILNRILTMMSSENFFQVLEMAVLLNEKILVDNSLIELLSDLNMAVGRKVRIFKRLTDFPLDARQIVASSIFDVVSHVIKSTS